MAEPVTPVKKEESKIEIKSTVKIPKLSSLKEEINTPVKKEEPLDLSVKNQFHKEELRQAWDDYANKLKKEQRDIEYAIIANREINLDENFNIKIKLDNLIQHDQLNTFKADFADYLRKRLNNNLIMIEAIVAPTENKKIIYTSEDKLKYLARKYPIVDDLKKRFGLETD
ncbi:MAG: hypothetical protein K2X86_12540, partial [Cytophagaceae bacterium]|nr:hypothetical protein [Cytophagaceae bacterium]